MIKLVCPCCESRDISYYDGVLEEGLDLFICDECEKEFTFITCDWVEE